MGGEEVSWGAKSGPCVGGTAVPWSRAVSGHRARRRRQADGPGGGIGAQELRWKAGIPFPRSVGADGGRRVALRGEVRAAAPLGARAGGRGARLGVRARGKRRKQTWRPPRQ